MWVMHGPIMDDDGQHGDEQLGEACSVRFVNPDLPGRVVNVYAYASAPLNDDVEHDLDSLGVDAMTEFMICRDIEDPGSTEEWCDYTYASLDTLPFNGDIEDATKTARAWIRAFDPNRDIDWNGEPFR
jgi:hypothetical protein